MVSHVLADLVHCVQGRARLAFFPGFPLRPAGPKRLAQDVLRASAYRLSVGAHFLEKLFHATLMGKFTQFYKGKVPNVCGLSFWV